MSGQAERAGLPPARTGTAVGVGQLLILAVLGVTAVAATREQFAQRRSAVVARKAQGSEHGPRARGWREATVALAELSDLQGKLEEHFRQAQQLASVGRVTSEVDPRLQQPADGDPRL